MNLEFIVPFILFIKISQKTKKLKKELFVEKIISFFTKKGTLY